MNISEIPFQSTATDEHIERALGFFDGSIEKVSVGNYRVVYEKGYDDYIGRPCHANLGQAPGDAIRKCVALYTDNSSKTELYRKWLWEESFVKRFVLAIHDCGAVISGDIPSILMQNIGIMSRHCLEFSGVNHPCFPMFDELYPKIGGDLAYVLSFNTTFNANTLDKWWDSPVLNGGASHRAWSLFQLGSLKNFLAGEFHIPKDKLKQLWSHHAGLYGGIGLCKATQSYSPQHPSFIQDVLEDEDIRNELSEYRKSASSGEMYRPPNPFARTAGITLFRPNDATFREVVECLIPAMKKKGLIP